MSKPSILYIEDYPVVQKIYVDMFVKQGFEITVAGDGKQALEYSKSGSYDVILVDLLLPQMSGLEFLKAYRADHPKDQDKTLVIVLTDFDDVHSLNDIRDLGVEHYWIKAENTPHVVSNKIKELLGTPS